MLIVSEATLLNSGVLETRSLPKKFFGRVFLVPRGATLRLWLRLIAEVQFLRYMLALLPFIVAPLLARDYALPVMQAPALMVVLVGLVELRVLRLSKSARARAVSAEDADRRLDTLSFRARACLRQIAARHEMREGSLHLVIEQSDLARIPPLTLVSVQSDTPGPHLAKLDAGDRAILEEGLFDADLTERDLLAVNHRDNLYVRDIVQEARAVTAHGRLAAYLEKRAAVT